jgi:hypothetical protein
MMRRFGLTLASVAVAAIGALAFAGPASATVATNPVTASAGASLSSQSNALNGDRWVGGAQRDMESGTWRGTVTNGDLTLLLGHHQTEKEARKEGRQKARELNGVMDGPGCDPPFILC